MHWLRYLAWLGGLLLATHFPQCLAGGGPENLLLVVNQNSDDSKTIANHYIRLRDIPPTNVVYLDWQGGLTQTTGEEFREQILKPVLTAIDARKLTPQIDYIVYSADFPYRIRFADDFPDEKLPRQFAPTASITGATYLWTYVHTKNPALVMPTVNWYVPPEARKNQMACQECASAPTRGFRARPLWKEDGTRTDEKDQGQTYFLSTMLGVTVPRGNTVDEVVQYLTRSMMADASQPQGTFYFMKNSDVRSKARHNCYRGVAEALQRLGARVAIQDGKVPEQAKNALGIMTGTASFSLDTNNVSIAPGAICDHLTSTGGSFDSMAQTKLSAWLRAGAAGASGTVEEPYAIQAKFPLPSMHLHYRRGASLAEAFYQSISGPYQLLIVGDPLCQPWAKPPAVKFAGLESGTSVQGTIEIKADVTPLPSTEVKTGELFIDGRLVARYPLTLTVPLDTGKLAAGRHELRLVAATDDDLEFRGRAVVSLEVAAGSSENAATETGAPPKPSVTLEVEGGPMVPATSRIAVTVTGPPNAAGIDILQNHRRLAHVEGNSGQVDIDTRVLGRGPVALVGQVSASGDGEVTLPPQSSRSNPYWLLVR